MENYMLFIILRAYKENRKLEISLHGTICFSYISINRKHVTLKLLRCKIMIVDWSIHDTPSIPLISDREKQFREKPTIHEIDCCSVVRIVWADRYCIENYFENIVQLVICIFSVVIVLTLHVTVALIVWYPVFVIVCPFEVKSQLYTGFCAFNFVKAIKMTKKILWQIRDVLGCSLHRIEFCSHIWNFSWNIFST